MGKELQSLAKKEFGRYFQGKPVLVSRGDSLTPLLRTHLVIDFSSPDSLSSLLQSAIKSSESLPVFVIGTTGLNDSQNKLVQKLSKKTAVLCSPNFSIGVQALIQFLHSASPLLEKLGYRSMKLTETHHTQKKDAPSGTALYLEKELKKSFPAIKTKIKSIREGSVVGFHEIEFEGAGENLILGHRALDRSIFARGALLAGLWLATKRTNQQNLAGYFSMSDYLKS